MDDLPRLHSADGCTFSVGFVSGTVRSGAVIENHQTLVILRTNISTLGSCRCLNVEYLITATWLDVNWKEPSYRYLVGAKSQFQ